MLFGHVGAPKAHRLAHDEVVDSQVFGVGRHRETEGTGSDDQELRIGERRHATSGDEYAGSDRYAVRSVRSTARATASPPPRQSDAIPRVRPRSSNA